MSDLDAKERRTVTTRTESPRRWIAAAVSFLFAAVIGAGAWWVLGDGGLYPAAAPGARSLTFGVYVSPEQSEGTDGNEATAFENEAARLAALLSEAMGRSVDVRLFQRHVDLIGALEDGTLDAARLNPYDYVEASSRADITPLFQEIRYGEGAYKAQFVALRESGIDSFRDLHGKRVAFPDPTSVSGFMLPVTFLERHGTSVDSMELVFSGSHVAVIRDVLTGDVDAGVTFAKAEKLWGNGDLPPGGPPESAAPVDELRVVAQTDGLPHGLIAARAGLPERERRDLAEALQTVAADRAGQRLFQTWWNVDGFTRTNPDGLALLRATLEMLPS